MESHFEYDECNNVKVDKSKRTVSLLPKVQINEWTFSLCLFIISSAVVIGKIYFLYGQPSVIKNRNHISSSNEIYLYNFQDVFPLPNEFIGPIMSNIDKYRWFLKALSSGLGVTAFTWFIIYKDSNIPGINPPSPFSPVKKKIVDIDDSKVQLNYLIGIVVGFLIFIYMCL